MTTIKAILFDHDGTLVDSEHSHYEMWVSVLIPYGINLTIEEYIRHHAGIPTPANAAYIVDKYAMKIAPSVLIEAKNSATESFLSKQSFPLTTGAREAIGLFSQKGVKLAIVTGAGKEGVNATILSNCFGGKFQAIVSGDDVENSKPSPDCYLLAIQRLAVNASECIAIEDSENGVTAAVSANIPCIAISTPMSRHHDLSKAMKTFANLNEAIAWITENHILQPQ
jgi:HAD superfamily hydrolase (TIGR01509 family)